MKTLFTTLIAFFLFTALGTAQITYPGHAKLRTIKTKPVLKYPTQFQVKRNCPDLAAHQIQFQKLSGGQYSGRVRIKGIVKNVGKQHFYTNPSQMSVILYEVHPGGRPRVVAKRSFASIPAGRTASVYFDRNWSTSHEFPPSYRLCVTYDPDIKLDSNPKNDDCNSANNCKTRQGSEVNLLFRRGS